MCFLALLNHALHLPRPLCVGVCTNAGLKKKRTPTLSHVLAHRKHLYFCAISQHRQDVLSNFSPLKVTAKPPNPKSPTQKWSQGNTILQEMFAQNVLASTVFFFLAVLSLLGSWGGSWSLSQPHVGEDRVHPWRSRQVIADWATTPLSSTRCWLTFWEKGGANTCLGGGLSPTYVGACAGKHWAVLPFI